MVYDIQISSYIKQMVCFKIRKLHTNGENLDMCMLIEHDCLCQIKIWNDGAPFDMVGEDHENSGPRGATIMNELE